VLNAAVALGFLAQGCVRDVAERVGPDRARRVADLLARGGLESCAGQDLDLLFEARPDVTEDEAHEMTARKSGALVAMACQVGAAVATEDPRVLATVGELGRRIGLIAQLLNDLDGVAADPGLRKSDLRRHKKTLPVAYLLRCAREEGIAPVAEWYGRDGQGADGAAEQRIADLLHDVGALHYTWVVADAHHREARKALDELARLAGPAAARGLSRRLPSVRARATPR
jgi:geranylgeranyl pyrophosphate synthase